MLHAAYSNAEPRTNQELYDSAKIIKEHGLEGLTQAELNRQWLAGTETDKASRLAKRIGKHLYKKWRHRPKYLPNDNGEYIPKQKYNRYYDPKHSFKLNKDEFIYEYEF